MIDITANEIYVREGGAVIKTRAPKEKVTDERVNWVATHSRLETGDEITVMCMNHTRDTLHWLRKYRVVSRHDYLKITPNEAGDVRHEDAYTIITQPEGDWIACARDPAQEEKRGPGRPRKEESEAA